MKKFTFRVGNSIVYETTEPNRVSKEDIVKRYKEQTGRSLTLIPGIDVQITSLPEEPVGGHKLRRTTPMENPNVVRERKRRENQRHSKLKIRFDPQHSKERLRRQRNTNQS